MNIQEALGPNGALAEALPHYQPREGQIQMAEHIAAALGDGEPLVVEAGTGIGKTFAYLIPAILSGAKVIVSTGTRNLQDQLFQQDIPKLRETLGVPFRAELLKGRANYLCRYRLQRVETEDEIEGERLQQIQLWQGQTQSGDLAEVSGLRDSDPLRAKITSTTDSCLGSNCPDYDKCYIAKARARAQEAELIVVNHHLLCADLALKDDGFGELLPDADAVVIDEAHQFPDVLAQFFGFGVSARQCRDLAKDVSDVAVEFGDMPVLMDGSAALVDATHELQTRFPFSRQRLEKQHLEEDESFIEASQALLDQLTDLEDELKAVNGRGPAVASAWRRCGVLVQRLKRWQEDDADAMVRWAERQRSGFALHAIPMDVAPAMATAQERQPGAWVFASATLSVAGRFEHFTRRLGLLDSQCVQIDSPFDYINQARLYVPRDLPEPSSPDYNRLLLEQGMKLIEAANGGCFWLCTSQRAVDEFGDLLREKGRWTVFVQGEEPRAQLLNAFREDGHAILVGTSSFWEGVDVRGRALRLVIIDRLPFAVPDDPVIKARSALLQAQGMNPFREHQIPQAVLTLKQGAGRLIRDMEDRGVLMIGDTRLRSKFYGRSFISSLPRMGFTAGIEDAVEFLEEISA